MGESREKRLYLLRHCSTTGSENGINGSRTDTLLSEKGLAAALELVEKLSVRNYDLIIVSPLQRTSQTIQPYLEALEVRPPIVIEDLTIERDLGELTNTRVGDGKVAASREASGKSKTEWVPPGGESCVQVYGRAQKFLEKIRGRSEKNILICGHQNFLRCFELAILGQSIDDEHFYSESPSRLELGEVREYAI